jgi:uncharacterized protein with ParB-like and HNH nuclease domain
MIVSNQQEYQNVIPIEVCSLKDLLEKKREYIFNIPDYQRPYVWDIEKIEALLKDIKEDSIGEPKPYYMGAILMHEKIDADSRKVLDIIDGQQRITTLLIIDYIQNKENSLLKNLGERLNLNYKSPKSQKNIAQNKKFLEENTKHFLKGTQTTRLIDNIIFTVVITKSEDDAFVFFDTQNNRGVKLSAIDFLKSYHLKALKDENEHIEKQRVAAKKWDKSNSNQALNEIFQSYLWRGRCWRGKKIEYENNDKILLEFQKKTRKKPSDNSITLYPNNKNRLATSLNFSVSGGIDINLKNISLQGKPINYPFAFRQPIEKGMGFFLFTEKYDALFQFIFNKEHQEGSELKKLKTFYEEVYIKSGFSHYLTDLFKLCILLFFDKFEDKRIFEFSLKLDYLLGAYRIKQSSIVGQTPVKILRDEQENLLDIIDNSYLPEEILEYLETIYPKDAYVNIESIGESGVRGNYKKHLLNYYFGETEKSNLPNKKIWIDEHLNKQ